MKKIILLFAICATCTQVQSQSWNLIGNAGTSTATHFIGTTDVKALYLKTSNKTRFVITSGGKIGIGTTVPGFKLDVKGGSINTDSLYRIGGNTVLSVKGTENTFIGNTENTTNTGISNTATGKGALYNNTTGYYNTATGAWALYANTTGYYNTATGRQALTNNTTGYQNVAYGMNALFANSTGNYNTATGMNSLLNNTIGHNNAATGLKALYSNTEGYYNTANGVEALNSNTTGSYNTANGAQALFYNTIGSNNTATGLSALLNNTSGHINTGIGLNALFYNTGGDYNTAVGAYSGNNNGTSPSNFTALGYNAGHVGSSSNSIEIGNSSITYIGGVVGWSAWSDRRIKDNIQNNVPGLSFITKLNPVTYKLNIHRLNEMCGINDTNEWEGKYDIEKITQTGFLAQEVEQAALECNYDFNGVKAPHGNAKLYSVQYAAFVVPLVKAVQELDEKNSNLEMQNAELKNVNTELIKRIEALEAKSGMEDKNKNIQTNNGGALLEQNSPNPFNTQTEIKFKLPSAFSSAQLIITDANGRQVRSDVLKSSSTIFIKAFELAAGTYSYSLIVDGKTIDSKQMVLTK